MALSERAEAKALASDTPHEVWKLAGLVYWDAFRSEPLAFLQGILWRLRGLKLRSRHRLSALAGRSPRAYALWIARSEGAARQAAPVSRDANWIQPVVIGSDVEATLKSVHEAGPALPPILLGGWKELHGADLPSDPATWICVVQAGDLVAPGAFAFYAAAIEAADGCGIIYADDDLIDEAGVRQSPHFKPQWNDLLARHHDFISGACIVRADVVPTEGPSGPPLVQVAIEQSAAGNPPQHLPLVLHHRRERPAPRLPRAAGSADRSSAASVTVIVPTRNQHELLRTCIGGVKAADYPGVRLIVVDNGSDEPGTLRYLKELEEEGATVLRMPGPFNYSRLNNEAVKMADTELLCFLNNDVEMIQPDWLSSLAVHASDAKVGAVGARLLYSDRSIQHAGVVIGIGGGAGHGHRFVKDGDAGYFHRHMLPQEVTAVTAACMVVGRQKFLDVGGYDETLFPVAFNDVDLCLKLNAAGWRSVYEPRAALIHHESKSRGKDSARRNKVRFASELAALKRKWGTDEKRDPYHHPHLSPFTEQFLVAL